MASVTYMAGAELPDLTLTWYDLNNALIDFSTGYMFTIKVGVPGATALFTKTTGITASAPGVDPNVTISWAATGELSTLAAGAVYQAQLTARRTSDSKDRFFPGGFQIVVDTAIA